jgi:hypothetical protein
MTASGGGPVFLSCFIWLLLLLLLFWIYWEQKGEFCGDIL